MVGFAILLMDSNSILNSTYPEIIINSNDKHHNKDIVWLLDDDEMCFGIYGFNTCSEMNAWTLKYVNDDNYFIEPYIDYNKYIEFDEMDYLSISMASYDQTPIPTIKQGKQKIFEYNKWSYKINDGKLSIDIFDPINMFMESYCIFNNQKSVQLVNCNDKYTQLLAVHYPLEQKRLQEEAVYKSNEDIKENNELDMIKEGYWECPKTKLLFPRSINTDNNLYNQSIQVFMGGDVYIKTVFNMNFKVYTMGWYVEADKLKDNLLFKPFQGLSSKELSNNPIFYETMIAESDYDRSLLIKLAMTIKCELMISGLMDELGMSDNNKILLANASRKYEHTDCEKGLELLFTWKHPQISNNYSNSFEVYVNKSLLAIINEPSIGRDFLSQFVNDEPVSPNAKIAFTSNFPIVLNNQLKLNISNNNEANSNKPKWLHRLKQSIHRLINRNKVDRKNISKSVVQSYSNITSNSINNNKSKVLWNKFYGKIYEKMNALQEFLEYVKVYISIGHHHHHKYNNKKLYLSIHISNNSSSWYIELFLSICLLFYFALLIIISLPPALLTNSKIRFQRVVREVRQTSIRRVESALRLTLSTTTSLASLVRSKSSDSLFNSLVSVERTNSIG